MGAGRLNDSGSVLAEVGGVGTVGEALASEGLESAEGMAGAGLGGETAEGLEEGEGEGEGAALEVLEVPVVYASALDALEASSARALYKLALERIALVAMMVNETSRQAQELSASVGEEVSRVIKEQRYLESRFEAVVAQRAVLRTLPNKTKYKENEAELAEIAQKLRVATQTLSRNLKDNPDVTENMAKIARERITLSSLLATLATEAETQGYETLVRTVRDEQERENLRKALKDKERATSQAVKELKAVIRQEKEDHEDAMAENRKRLTVLKNELKELKSVTTVDGRYAEKNLISGNACSSRMQHLRISELERESLKLRQRIEIEKRCNAMSKDFLSKKMSRLSDDNVKWSNKHDSETQAKDRELDALKAKHQLDATKMLEVEQAYQKEVAAKELRIAEEKRAKDSKIENQQSDEQRARAATKIQALYRGFKSRAASGGGGGKKKKGKK